MKRAISVFGLAAVLLVTLSLASRAQDNAAWTGWISDSNCGAKGMNAHHKACAETCVKTNGASWVFVDSKDSRVYPIKNQGMINADTHLGHQVTVQGRVNNDGTLSVDVIGAAKS
jgi:hypothetical protein